jgi:hypothetical protein
MAAGATFAVATVTALVVALTPLIIEALRAARPLARLPLPSTRQRSSRANVAVRSQRASKGSRQEGVAPLPVKPVRRLVFICDVDSVDEYFYTFTVLARHDENLAVLRQGHCLFSELPLALSGSLDAWEKWIADPAHAAGVTSV